MAEVSTQPSGLQAPLWRAIAVYRIAALVYASVLVITNVDAYRQPLLAWPVVAVMAAWTVLTTYAYADPARRRPPLLITDLLLTIAVLAASVVVMGRPALEAGRPTLAVAWHVAPVLAWAVAGAGGPASGPRSPWARPIWPSGRTTTRPRSPAAC